MFRRDRTALRTLCRSAGEIELETDRRAVLTHDEQTQAQQTTVMIIFGRTR
jgi:hypothetical protein